MTSEPARLELERTGGFANIPLRTAVDLDDLGTADRQRYLDLIGALDLPALAEQAPTTHPDGFSYRLRLRLGQDDHELRYGDGSAPEPLRQLTRDLVDRARTER